MNKVGRIEIFLILLLVFLPFIVSSDNSNFGNISELGSNLDDNTNQIEYSDRYSNKIYDGTSLLIEDESDLLIENVTIRNIETEVSSVGIEITNSHNILIKNLTVESITGTTSFGESGEISTSFGIRIENSIAITIQDSQIRDVFSSKTSVIGCFIRDSSDIVSIGNTVSKITSTESDAHGYQIVRSENILIQNNFVDTIVSDTPSSFSSGFLLQDVTSITITDTIISNILAGETSFGFIVDSSIENATISNNVVSDSRVWLAEIPDGITCTNNTIFGTHVEGCEMRYNTTTRTVGFNFGGFYSYLFSSIVLIILFRKKQLKQLSC